MRKSHRPYAPEFRRQMVDLVRSGGTPEALSREFEPTAQPIWNWVRQADRDEGRRHDGPTNAEATLRPAKPHPNWPTPWAAAIPVGAEPAGANPRHIWRSCPAAPDPAARPAPLPQTACATDPPYSAARQTRGHPRRSVCPPGKPKQSWPVPPGEPPPSDFER